MQTHLRHQYEQADIFTWIQVHNILPLMTFIGGMIIQYYIFQGNMEIIKQKQELQDIRIASMQSTINQLTSSHGEVYGIATRSATLNVR